ncbi:hypothetical protein BpHYR1_028199 [Brachionus plicatilis]|uniref:Uncharacterized protein n=1 Tax=Brachionus plicatilis TaxID=10195 RepID=A0A3M7Q0U4_BRAPC|nr:hypothetical protein BpHYR1_028199 [Brachionus plicatilis]
MGVFESLLCCSKKDFLIINPTFKLGFFISITRVNVCACTSHMTLGINARVPQHGITFNEQNDFDIRGENQKNV